jgi:hypothetical protein
MVDRINHVKVVTPHPELVDAFLREVTDVPAGWPLGASVGRDPVAADAPLGPGGELTMDEIMQRREGGAAGNSEFGGFITGDSTSRQFQIFKSDNAAFWAVCIGTRNIEQAWERCKARGVPATPITVADWNERDNIRNFFCIVGGVTFEVIRVEPKGTNT